MTEILSPSGRFDQRAGRVILRADFFPGSGVGHIKRCNILARAFVALGFQPILLLNAEARSLDFPFETVAAIRYLPKSGDELADAMATSEIAKLEGAKLIVRDSYRVAGAWEDYVADAGFPLVAIDDLGTSTAALVAINYTPGAVRPGKLHQGSRFLGGAAYMITDSPCLPARAVTGQPLKALAHAGGTGNFSLVPGVVAGLARVAAAREWALTWLCPVPESAQWLRDSGYLSPRDRIETWRDGAVWQDQDLVVGPASTSLYEAIMQGTLPISFPLSGTQNTMRDSWLKLGHALHLDPADARDPDTVARLLDLAHDHHAELRLNLDVHASELDGLGAERVADIVAAMIAEPSSTKPLPEAGGQTSDIVIRPCSIADAEGFRIARNAPEVRAVSTNPDHFIDWPEHLRWWLSTDAERFVLESSGRADAYFWHRARVHEGCGYMTAGWFPATAAPSLPAVLRLLDWQHKRTAKTHPDHGWVATIEKSNSAVLTINRRMGFKEAGPKARAAAAAFWPGTDERFLILEKPPR